MTRKGVWSKLSQNFASLLCSLNSFSGNSTWPDWRNYQQDGICTIRVPNHEGDPFIAVTFIIEKKNLFNDSSCLFRTIVHDWEWVIGTSRGRKLESRTSLYDKITSLINTAVCWSDFFWFFFFDTLKGITLWRKIRFHHHQSNRR